MKRINMTKYGFIRFEEGDFSDDGNRFTCYTLSTNSRLRISKLVSDGRVYLSSSMNGNRLDHTEYSKLSHYQVKSTNSYLQPSYEFRDLMRTLNSYK